MYEIIWFICFKTTTSCPGSFSPEVLAENPLSVVLTVSSLLEDRMLQFVESKRGVTSFLPPNLPSHEHVGKTQRNVPVIRSFLRCFLPKIYYSQRAWWKVEVWATRPPKLWPTLISEMRVWDEFDKFSANFNESCLWIGSCSDKLKCLQVYWAVSQLRKGTAVSDFQQHTRQKRPCHADLVVLDPESGRVM